MKQKGTKNLDIQQRIKLQKLLALAVDTNSIAKELSVSSRTIYREIERGAINGQYSAEYAQQVYESKCKNKGRKPELLIDKYLAQKISNLILNEKLSPEKVQERILAEGNYCPSKQTIYLAIDNGLIPNVTRESLNNTVTTVFSKGLIQLPKWVRDELQLIDGDKVELEMKDNYLAISKRDS